MSGEDDLGDFFAEIEQVTENIEQYKESYEEDEGPPKKLQKIEEQAPPPPPPQSFIVNQVISKPAEISKPSEAPSYPMFTYEAVPKNTESSDGLSYGVPSSSGAMTSSSQAPPTFARQNTKFVRKAANETWVDDTLQEWPENDYRIFVGDLGKEVNTEMLTKHFQPLFKSFAKAKVIKAQNETKSKGYGFVSFLDPNDCLRAVKELNGKYLGSRPMTIKMSHWKDRDAKEVKKKEQKKRKLQESLGL